MTPPSPSSGHGSRCPDCGAVVPPSTALGSCPRCLLAFAATEEPGAGDPGAEADRWIGQCIGDYAVVGVIARGGMGLVLKARQVRLNRLVALKLIAAGELASQEAVRRFKIEAEAAAALQHPHIVPIFECGEIDNRHYFSMKLLEGGTLTERLAARRQFPIREAVAMMVSIARAVEFAHQRGILHRDLKPGNILFDAAGTPHVADFGLALRIEADAALTLSGAAIGTPQYMAPEQALGRSGTLTTATDVYGLGAMLYEMLAGAPPFTGRSVFEVLERVTKEDPKPLHALNPAVDRDLETVCLKCLEKAPSARYRSAAEFADDLEHWLRHEPIAARTPSTTERLRKWTRRQPVLAASILAGALLLLGVTAALTVMNIRISRAGRELKEENYASSIAIARQYLDEGDLERARRVLFNCPEEFRHWEWGRLLLLCHQPLLELTNVPPVESVHLSADSSLVAVLAKAGRAWTWPLGQEGSRRPLGEGPAKIRQLAFGPAHTECALRFADGHLEVWDAQANTNRLAIPGTVSTFAFSPDGQSIAVARPDGAVDIWSLLRGTRATAGLASAVRNASLAFSEDGGQLLASAPAMGLRTNQPILQVWDASSGNVLARIRAPELAFKSAARDTRGLVWAFHGDGQVRIWNARTGQFQASIPDSTQGRGQYLLSGNGGTVICQQDSRVTGLWDAETGRYLGAPTQPARHIHLEPAGDRFVTTDQTRVSRVWNAKGTLLQELKGHGNQTLPPAFSSQASLVAVADLDHRVRVWSLDPGPSLIPAPDWVYKSNFSPDGRHLAVAGWERLAYLVDAFTGREERRFAGHHQIVTEARFTPDGRRIVTTSYDRTAKIWDAQTGALLRTLGGHRHGVHRLAIDATGTRCATACLDGTIKVWDLGSGTELQEMKDGKAPLQAIAYSHDGRYLASGGLDGARLWDAISGRLLHRLEMDRGGVFEVDFSPDDGRLATGAGDRNISVWSVPDGSRVKSWTSRTRVAALRFSPDGQRLASTTGEADASLGKRGAEIWNLRAGRELLVLNEEALETASPNFSPDGRRLMTAGLKKSIRICDTFPWRDSEYPGQEGESMAARVDRFARGFWRTRMEALVRAGPSTGLTNQAGPISLPRTDWPARAANVPARAVDLTPHYNALLDVAWRPIRSTMMLEDHLGSLPAGLVQLQGIPFDVRGLIQLANGSGDFQRLFPGKTARIAIHRTGNKLHFLQATVNSAGAGDLTGRYVLRYTDGNEATLELRYGRDLRDWWYTPSQHRLPSEATMAWTGTNAAVAARRDGIRLFLRTWSHPHPEKELASIEFISAFHPSAAPFLVALTIE